MSVQIVQAARASAPYPWTRFWSWALERGLDAQHVQTLLENGVEPEVTAASGLTLDPAVPYPGLPSLEPSTDGAAPSFTPVGGATT